MIALTAPPNRMDATDVTTQDLLVILDVSRRLAEQRSVQPLVDYVARTIFEFIPVERCIITIFGSDGELSIQTASDRNGNVLADASDQMSRSILDRVRTTLTPLLVGDAQKERAFRTSPSVRSLRLRSVMCVPLISHGQAIGAIYVENRSLRGQFTEANLVPLVLMANQVAVALENARHTEFLEAHVTERTRALQEAYAQLERQTAQLYELSIRDSLTSLYNRRHFTESLSQSFATALRYGLPLSLVVLDIDHFKQINDTFSHLTGDRVLQAIADILRANARQPDIIARIGGEEFALIMPMTVARDAEQAVERLRERVADHQWHEVAPALRVTLSAGVASNDEGPEPEDVLRIADARLYQAKLQGRNRVVASPPA